MGGRSDLRGDLARLCLCGLCDRRLRSPYCRLARIQFAANWPGSWMRWNRHCMTVRKATPGNWSTIVIAVSSTCRFVTLNDCKRQALNPPSAVLAILTITRWPIQRIVQDGGDPSARSVAELRRCWVRDINVGGLVQ